MTDTIHDAQAVSLDAVALGWECLRQGAAILRVHDVQEAVDTVRLFDAYERNRK